MSADAPPAAPAAPKCPACGGVLRGSRLLHEGPAGEVFRVSRCRDCHIVLRRHYILRFVRQEAVPRT